MKRKTARGMALAVVGISAICVAAMTYRAVLPAAHNHVVVINQTSSDLEDVTLLTYDARGVLRRSEAVFGCGSGMLQVYDYRLAFEAGRIDIMSGDTKAATVKFLPPGRYGRTLVIVVRPDGTADCEWNAVNP